MKIEIFCADQIFQLKILSRGMGLKYHKTCKNLKIFVKMCQSLKEPQTLRRFSLVLCTHMSECLQLLEDLLSNKDSRVANLLKLTISPGLASITRAMKG